MDSEPAFSPLIFAALFLSGLVFGSFATAMAYRLPRGLPLFLDRSGCPACGHVLGVGDLLPLVSWLWSRGHCRHCGAVIAVRYPLTELAAGLLFLSAWPMSAGQPVGLVCLCGLAVGLLIILLIDLEWRIIPDAVLLCLLPLLLVWRWQAGGGWLDGLAGGAAGLAVPYAVAVLFRRWRGRDGLGMGDVKVFGLAGLAVGLSGLGAYLLLTSMTGILFGLAWRAGGREAAFPLGPALAAGLWLSLAFPDLADRLF